MSEIQLLLVGMTAGYSLALLTLALPEWLTRRERAMKCCNCYWYEENSVTGPLCCVRPVSRETKPNNRCSEWEALKK